MTDSTGRPTLRTIAAQTGLAVATVSRALKDAPDIARETKRRVREAADSLGYRPNRAGVRLRTGKTNVVALVLSTEEAVMNHTSRLIYSVAAALNGTAYHMIVMPYFPAQDPMAPIRYIVETGSADGVIINQTMPDDPRVRYMAEHDFPFATHGRTDMGLDHPYFDFDNEAFARLAVRALAQRGRRRLALIAPPLDQSYARHMTTGFLSQAHALGLGTELVTEVNSDSSAARIEAFAALRFAAADPPDALLVGATTAAMATVGGIEAAGLHLGTDVDMVAKEAIRFLRLFRPQMIVVHEDVSLAGTFLARAVVARIEGKADALGHQQLDVPDQVD